MTEDAVILCYNFSLSDFSNFPAGRSHFSLLPGPSLNPVYFSNFGGILLIIGPDKLKFKTLDLLISTADSLCKQFGPRSLRSDQTTCEANFGSKLMVFLKAF